MDSMKRQKDMTPEDEPPDWKVSNVLWRKSGGKSLIAPEKTKQLSQGWNDVQLWMCLVVKVKSDAVKSIEQEPEMLGPWSKVKDMVKQEMTRVNTDILRISELKWTGVGKFNSDDHSIYYCGQESLRRNGVALIVNKNPKMQYLGATSKMRERCWLISKANNSTSL